eukprot:scaffold5359_cov265-Pinguiococcus_pyrenoidosus.AAC.6
MTKSSGGSSWTRASSPCSSARLSGRYRSLNTAKMARKLDVSRLTVYSLSMSAPRGIGLSPAERNSTPTSDTKRRASSNAMKRTRWPRRCNSSASLSRGTRWPRKLVDTIAMSPAALSGTANAQNTSKQSAHTTKRGRRRRTGDVGAGDTRISCCIAPEHYSACVISSCAGFVALYRTTAALNADCCAKSKNRQGYESRLQKNELMIDRT